MIKRGRFSLIPPRSDKHFLILVFRHQAEPFQAEVSHLERQASPFFVEVVVTFRVDRPVTHSPSLVDPLVKPLILLFQFFTYDIFMFVSPLLTLVYNLVHFTLRFCTSLVHCLLGVLTFIS